MADKDKSGNDVCEKYINEMEKNEVGKIRMVEQTKYDKFKLILDELEKIKIKLDDRHTSKEDVKKYKENYEICEKYILKIYLSYNLRKPKIKLNNYTAEFYVREFKEPLTMETLGKYFYKFYYYTKVINDREERELKKRNANGLSKLLVDFIEKERYIAEKLAIRFIKNKKDIDYSEYYEVEKRK